MSAICWLKGPSHLILWPHWNTLFSFWPSQNKLCHPRGHWKHFLDAHPKLALYRSSTKTHSVLFCILLHVVASAGEREKRGPRKASSRHALNKQKTTIKAAEGAAHKKSSVCHMCVFLFNGRSRNKTTPKQYKCDLETSVLEWLAAQQHHGSARSSCERKYNRMLLSEFMSWWVKTHPYLIHWAKAKSFTFNFYLAQN